LQFTDAFTSDQKSPWTTDIPRLGRRGAPSHTFRRANASHRSAAVATARSISRVCATRRTGPTESFWRNGV